MHIDQAMNLYKDKRTIARGLPTNAVITQLRRIETPVKTRGIHARDSYIHVDLTGVEGKADVFIYTDGSKTEFHVGTGMVAVQNSKEIHIETQRLNFEYTVFQPELCGIGMAMD
jgi:hypothetical protein